MLLILLLLIGVCALYGFGYNGGVYRGQGLGLGGVVLVILILLWLTGNL